MLAGACSTTTSVRRPSSRLHRPKGATLKMCIFRFATGCALSGSVNRRTMTDHHNPSAPRIPGGLTFYRPMKIANTGSLAHSSTECAPCCEAENAHFSHIITNSQRRTGGCSEAPEAPWGGAPSFFTISHISVLRFYFFSQDL